MHPAPSPLNSSADRPIGMRTRPDLVVQEMSFQGQPSWVVKDPLAMKFYRLQEAEHIVFESLRESISHRELKERLESRFPETSVRLSTIQQLIVQMQRMGLLISQSTDQAKGLHRQHQKEQRRKWVGTLSSITAIRFPGFDPERLLAALYGKVRWMFTLWFTGLAVAICFSAVTLVLANLEDFYLRLPEFHSFFSVKNLILMCTLLIFTKSVHELGHGLMCKHFGGECHQIGFMLLLFTPAMYCDTSDSWILPNRWHRIAIGAAGMYVEIVMASICTFIWWYTHPGWLHYLSLNIMFLCSVSTVMFNANPLMRYDGYFMLSDLLEIPNLSSKAQLSFVSAVRHWTLGLKPVDQRQLPSRNRVWFTTYGIMSFGYRWMLVIAIFWFLRSIFEPYGLSILAIIVLGISLLGMTVIPLLKAAKYMIYPGRFREVNGHRFAGTLGLVAALLLTIAFLPVPQSVLGHARVRPHNPQLVTVTSPGTITEIRVRPGDAVRKGDVIAVLTNDDLKLRSLKLEGELATAKSDLIGFELNRNKLIDSERHIAELRVKIRNLSSVLEIKHQELARLVLRADRDGVVVLPDNVPSKPDTAMELHHWHGTPLDAENLGAFLPLNTVVCLVAQPGQYEASVMVDQSDAQLVTASQSVSLMLEQSIGRRFFGKVTQVSQEEALGLPRELSQTNGGPIAVKVIADGQECPLLKCYEVFAEIESPGTIEEMGLGSGFHGQAKIHCGYSTIASIAARYFRNVIHFR